MKIYALKFVTSEPGLPNILSFEATDRMAGLVLGHEKAAQRSAQLWDAEQLLCTIRRQAPARDIVPGKRAGPASTSEETAISAM
jgi:hypothetical protein